MYDIVEVPNTQWRVANRVCIICGAQHDSFNSFIWSPNTWDTYYVKLSLERSNVSEGIPLILGAISRLTAVHHSLTHSSIHIFLHSVIHSLTESFAHSLTQSFTHSLSHSFPHSFTHSFLHSFTHSFIPSFSHSFTRLFLHSLIHSLIPSFIPSFNSYRQNFISRPRFLLASYL